MTATSSAALDGAGFLTDPIAYAQEGITTGLRALGCVVIDIRQRDAKGRRLLVVEYLGYDMRGHLTTQKANVDVGGQHLAIGDMDARIARQLAMQTKQHERLGGIPPVAPGPDMTLSHLHVNMQLARRLRLTHGAAAQDALRRAVVQRLSETCGAMEGASEPLISLDNHRVDHREELSDRAAWKARTLVVRNVDLPDTLLSTLVGRPISVVARHPVLGDDPIGKVEITNRDAEAGRKTMLVTPAPIWIRADEI